MDLCAVVFCCCLREFYNAASFLLKIWSNWYRGNKWRQDRFYIKIRFRHIWSIDPLNSLWRKVKNLSWISFKFCWPDNYFQCPFEPNDRYLCDSFLIVHISSRSCSHSFYSFQNECDQFDLNRDLSILCRCYTIELNKLKLKFQGH